jgi:hypothetical protein
MVLDFNVYGALLSLFRLITGYALRLCSSRPINVLFSLTVLAQSYAYELGGLVITFDSSGGP